MPGDDPRVRRVGREETTAFLDAEQAGRRRRRPGLRELAPGELAAHLETTRSRPRLARVRVTDPAYRWRWPWATLEHVDVLDCDLEGVAIEARLLRASKLDDCRFDKVAMGGANIAGTTFTACTFDAVGLAGTATASVRNSRFVRGSFIRLDARAARFDRVTFEGCEIVGLRGSGTIFNHCTFVRTAFRGNVTGIVLDGCSFDAVDMSEALMSGCFIIDSRLQRELLFPAQRSGFGIDYRAYRAAVEALAPTLSAADAAALRAELASWATNAPAEVLLDEETFAQLSPEGRQTAMDTLFERRLIRRG